MVNTDTSEGSDIAVITPRIEHNKCQVGKPTALGLMFEITAPVAPVIEATKHKAKALVFVIDRSGSMSGGRLESVKAVLEETLPRLNPEDHIAIVSFDDVAVVNLPLATIKNLDLKNVRKIISDIHTGGSTNLEAGYRLGLKEAEKVTDGVETTVIVLSDGQANAGETDPQALSHIATAATEHLVTTSTIGIGQGYDEDVLGALADGGNGNHIAGITQGEAVDGLQSEIDGLLTKTMVDVTFEIVIGPDFTGNGSKIKAGRKMKKWDYLRTQVKALLGDLSSGEEKNVFFNIVLDAHQMATPGVKQGIQVTYSYTDVLTGQRITNSETFEIELVAADAWVEPDRDPDIKAELQLVRNQDIMQEAMNLFAQGKEQEANALLEAAGLQMEEMYAAGNLGSRSSKRMMESSNIFYSMSQIDDLNIKKKMLWEQMNREKRDRRKKDEN